MADASRKTIASEGATGALATIVSATNEDNTAYSGVLVRTSAQSQRAGGAALSNVAASAANVTLAAANANRRGLLIFNDADKALSVKFGAVATAASFTVQIAPGGYYELPQPVYVGIVDGIWAAAPTGAARVTELT